MGFPRHRAWRVTLLAVLTSALAVAAIGWLKVDGFERVEQPMPEAAHDRCRSLGVAGPMEWEGMSPQDFRFMVAEMDTMGAEWIRLGVIWRDIEPSPGVYRWEALDERLNIALDAGLRPLLLIHTTPAWVTGFGTVGSGAAEQYAQFAAEVAERYRDQADAYEIWNEPNIARFWDRPSPESYAELLTATAPLLREIDPDAEVVSAGLAPALNIEDYSVTIDRFLRGLYELDALRDVTAVGIHPYSYPEMPSGSAHWNTFAQLPKIQAIMHSHGDYTRSIWLTEYGAPSAGEGGVGTALQADMVVEALQLTDDSRYLGPIFMYTMYDLDLGAEDRESYFGLLYGPGDPKPAYLQLRDAAEQCALLSDGD